jgi:thiol-disulfide isomerase/thioredoxin
VPEPFASARPSPAKVVSRILDAVAILVIAFAVWKIFISPRIFTSASRAVPAPPIVLSMMDGKPLPLASAHGRVVFLDFWATWCAPCKLSIPLIERYKAAHPDALVVSVDAGEEVGIAKRFAFEHKMKRVAFDPEMTVAHAFGVQVFPTMIVIDRQGKVRAKWIGFNPAIESAMANAAKTF